MGPELNCSLCCAGIIISGGLNDLPELRGGLKQLREYGVLDTVEAFLPFTNQHCRLPNLPQPRFAHTMDGFLICGGIRYSYEVLV